MTAASMKQLISPQSASGSFLASIGVHVLIYGSVIAFLGLNLSTPTPQEEYLELGYQTFDAPPEPAKEERRVAKSPEPKMQTASPTAADNAPKEMQDEKSDVAGTQKAVPENNIGNESSGTAATTPYYKIKPKYPRAALLAGTEGWVMLLIDVTETGDVENVRIVDGEQREMFGSEARRAVSQYKYRPFTDASGHPVRRQDHQIRVEFKLTDQESASL